MKSIIVQNLKLPLGAAEADYARLFAGQLGIDKGNISRILILRQAVDARKKSDIFFNVHAQLDLEDDLAQRLISQGRAKQAVSAEGEQFIHGTQEQRGRIVVAGLGPAGLFAAYILAKEGYKPLVIERGKPMEERSADVEAYWRGESFDPNSNVAFGEGGAGTFSDGKLTTRIKDSAITTVLNQLIDCGAPKEIAYQAKPHIGTDRLRTVIVNLRKKIIALGGEVRFDTRLSDLRKTDGSLTHIQLSTANGSEWVQCCALILCTGHGASDVYRLLNERGVALAAKPFAIGVRAEHPQLMINKAQWGDFFDHPRLGAASYNLTHRSGNRGVYTFCMCPGGRVIASSTERDTIVTNGMSYHSRSGSNANAAVVVQIMPSDWGGGAMEGLNYRSQLERTAFLQGGGDGCAPCSTVEGLFADAIMPIGSVKPTYLPGVKSTRLSQCLPDFVYHGVRDGIMGFARQLKGYDTPDAVLTAIESRTSSPIRILRGEDYQSPTLKNLYPTGEGAGYAGGIVSAAVDGLRAAQKVIARFITNA